jgi:flagellar biosynthesis protein FlhF
VNTFRFIAQNPAEALAQIHASLGPEAVVLNVQPLAVAGMARLWQRGRKIEVTAGLPENGGSRGPMPPCPAQSFAPFQNAAMPADFQRTSGNRWRSVAWLETMGLLPANGERLQTQLRRLQGDSPPDSLDTEWALVSNALSHFWLNPPTLEDGNPPRPHVFIGPPGSGKTTALCKWLTLSVLMEGRAARVWRLDGKTANTAEWLTVHCEMLGAPLERFWSNPNPNGDLLLVDLPGVEISDSPGLATLRSQLAALPSPRIHLVLNAAYETAALFAQWQVFRTLEPEDLIFTHLDEETQRVKLWNFVFGTNCSLRFLGAGQKIPGEFRTASPEFLLPAKTR